MTTARSASRCGLACRNDSTAFEAMLSEEKNTSSLLLLFQHAVDPGEHGAVRLVRGIVPGRTEQQRADGRRRAKLQHEHALGELALVVLLGRGVADLTQHGLLQRGGSEKETPHASHRNPLCALLLQQRLALCPAEQEGERVLAQCLGDAVLLAAQVAGHALDGDAKVVAQEWLLSPMVSFSGRPKNAIVSEM